MDLRRPALGRALASIYARPERSMTAAELDVACRIADSHSIADIARQRGTSPNTTRNQIAAIHRKLRARSRRELALRLYGAALQPIDERLLGTSPTSHGTTQTCSPGGSLTGRNPGPAGESPQATR